MATAEAQGNVNFDGYTIDKYMAIVKWKTAFYSFYLPVASAMFIVSRTYYFIKDSFYIARVTFNEFNILKQLFQIS